MREHKNFWDRNAGRYDRFMRKDRAAYETMYGLIRPVVKGKTVLELATGTGLHSTLTGVVSPARLRAFASDKRQTAYRWPAFSSGRRLEATNCV